MVTHVTTPGRLYEDMNVGNQHETGDSLIVMHAPESRATHVLVIDPDLQELDRVGGLLGAQGFKVTLSSALLEMDSLAYFAADLLVVRPPAGKAARWEAYIRAVAEDSRLRGMPVVWLVSPRQRAPAVSTALAHILVCPWTPFEFLTLVDSLVASSRESREPSHRPPTPGQPLAGWFAGGAVGSD